MYLKQIKKEYPLIYERVVEQAGSRSQYLADPQADVNNCLYWSSTTEGTEFWSAVQEEDWEKAQELQPDLFPEDGLAFNKVTTNGLFK